MNSLLNDIVGLAIYIISTLVIVQFIIGLLFSFNVVSSRNEFLFQVYRSINQVLDPLLRPIRRIMPDTGAIDFSPMVLLFGLMVIQRVLVYSLIGV